MTPNEKKALMKFKEIEQGNTVRIAGTLGVTINYAGDICKKLHAKGYLERLLPGVLASYRITPLGEEQVKEEGEIEKKLTSAVGSGEEDKKEVEEIEEYECTNCGATVKEEDTECRKCGTVFEEGVEEEVTESSTQEQSPERTNQVEGQSKECKTEFHEEVQSAESLDKK